MNDDDRWMGAALALAERGRGRTAPNPNVGCVIVNKGRVVGHGWTRPGGRPHAEWMALEQAGAAARGATCYTTLEPCAHVSPRGPACADSLATAGIARVVVAIGDPDPRTDGAGLARLRATGATVETGVCVVEARRAMAGFLTRQALGRPFVTLKLATSLDGCIATAAGESQWITGPEARAHAHLERSRHEAIVVGRGTYEADVPTLDVRLAGLEERSPRRFVLTRHSSQSGGPSPERAPGETGREMGPRFRGDDLGGWEALPSPDAIATLDNIDHLLVEGGTGAASAFLARDVVDRLLLYRAPILIGGGKLALGEIGLTALAGAHGRWRLTDARALGSDRLEVYERVRQ